MESSRHHSSLKQQVILIIFYANIFLLENLVELTTMREVVELDKISERKNKNLSVSKYHYD